VGLTLREFNVIEAWREFGVLQDVQPRHVNKKRCVIVTCSDGDRFPETFLHQIGMQGGRCETCTHTFAWHGGALACAPCSPINPTKHDYKVFLGQIAAAHKVKKDLEAIFLYAHGPCGAVGLSGLSLEEEPALQIKARSTIEAWMLRDKVETEVVPLFHVDYGQYANGEGKMRTYELSQPHWAVWASRHRIRSMA
jgi:hypothetical protein